MLVYRITRKKYAQDMSGEGAKLYGGRWNRPGVAALYTSEHRSLALLELIVHFNTSSAMHLDYEFLSIEIDDRKIVNADIKENTESDSGELQWLTTERYFFEDNALAIRVPSVIIPQEFNVIINPVHSEISGVSIKNSEKVMIDKRLKLV